MIGVLTGAFKGAPGLKHEWMNKIEASYGKKQEISKDYGITDFEAPNYIDATGCKYYGYCKKRIAT